jgi:hypothetical protein
VAHGWLYRLYHGRLADRQKEINRIAGENREYREMFLKLLAQKFTLESKEVKKVK